VASESVIGKLVAIVVECRAFGACSSRIEVAFKSCLIRVRFWLSNRRRRRRRRS
jgi:hypothetical protein